MMMNEELERQIEEGNKVFDEYLQEILISATNDSSAKVSHYVEECNCVFVWYSTKDHPRPTLIKCFENIFQERRYERRIRTSFNKD